MLPSAWARPHLHPDLTPSPFPNREGETTNIIDGFVPLPQPRRYQASQCTIVDNGSRGARLKSVPFA
jgi:hypothetical protein